MKLVLLTGDDCIKRQFPHPTHKKIGLIVIPGNFIGCDSGIEGSKDVRQEDLIGKGQNTNIYYRVMIISNSTEYCETEETVMTTETDFSQLEKTVLEMLKIKGMHEWIEIHVVEKPNMI